MAKSPKDISSLTHETARRLNNPTAEMASLYEQQAEQLGEGELRMQVPRQHSLDEGETRPRDPDRDPQIVWNGARITITTEQMQKLAETGELEIGDAQLVWRGKDSQDWSDLVVNAPPIYVQEKVQPKAIIDDLKRRSTLRQAQDETQADLFADFNGIDDLDAQTEFYQHTKHWQNRFILGDSLQVMASLAEREALKGQVQCIYFDPPYGIKFNSNWQVSTLSRDVKDGKAADVTREPEQVKAFRDTWKDGIHSYLTYLRDRLTVARELLTESGSIFVQIGDENVHRVRAVMDEVFGEENFLSTINYVTTSGFPSRTLTRVGDTILWYGRLADKVKYRGLFKKKDPGDDASREYKWLLLPDGTTRALTELEFQGRIALPHGAKRWRYGPLTSSGASPAGTVDFQFRGKVFHPGNSNHWKVRPEGLRRLDKAGLLLARKNSIAYYLFAENYPVQPINNYWQDTKWGFDASDKSYVVQTNEKVIQRCILMATDPGDLVLDPTCGSGTTATVAEQWGRRWITIDTSRVALALARTRLMSARYPYYLLADSPEGRDKESAVTGKVLADPSTGSGSTGSGRGAGGDIRQGFVYERAPHITLKSIANNAQIDDIWEKWQAVLEPLREELNAVMGFTSPLEGEDVAKRQEGGSEGDDAPPSALPGISPTRGENGQSQGWAEWQIPRDLDAWLETDEGKAWASSVISPTRGEISQSSALTARIRKLHADWWEGRIARQKEIDDSIARAADVEMLYDRPYVDNAKVRVAGPFTVESLSPHRVVTARDDTLAGEIAAAEGAMQPGPASQQDVDFGQMVLDNLRAAGVHAQARGDTIRFNSVEPWPGEWLAAEGRYTDGDDREKRAAILIGPEFGTLTRSQITAAAREASDARFDTLVACAFNFDAQASDLSRLGPLPILKARMNPDLHMSDELKTTGKGNLFVVFGEPDVDLIETDDGRLQVKVNGVDVFDPSTGDIRSDDAAGIAAWFIDTDYNEESFFVRHAYFLGSARDGGSDPYKALKTALKAEIDKEAWETLYSDVSRPFPRPETGRIAVKVINHFGDEVLKVFGV